MMTNLLKGKKVFICADHGLAIVYFLQSDIVPELIRNGVEVVVLTDEGILPKVSRTFARPHLQFESLRLKEAKQYVKSKDPSIQWWTNFLRRVGASNRINVEALTSHVEQVGFEAGRRRKALMPFMWALIGILRRSKAARGWLVDFQKKYTPDLYSDLFEKHTPDLIITSTPGWRLDRIILREAARRGTPSASVIVGWDNPSSYSLPGAPVQRITCWSEIQKQELIQGSDWDADRVNVGGIPSYDGYFRNQWIMKKSDYFKLHKLDTSRKLLGYACSFITFSPNYQNIEALAKLVIADELDEPCQLLIRLHPNHFMEEPLFIEEREKIFKLAKENAHIHVVEPVALGGELGYYSGEDMPEKTSMMAYSDVFLTVYSTMVVEAAIQDRPIVSVCIDAPGGWKKAGKFSLPLSRIGNWPTHQRFRDSQAGRVAQSSDELKICINTYLRNPEMDSANRKEFIENEVTFTDGNSGLRTATFFMDVLQNGKISEQPRVRGEQK